MYFRRFRLKLIIVLAAGAAVALCAVFAHACSGWYLMSPEALRDSSGTVHAHPEAPLTDWSLIQSFNSAEKCQLAKIEELKYQKKETLIATFIQDSHCIASDDPRLKE